MTQLGGHAIYLGPADIGLGKRESVSDVAKVTSAMADVIMARTFEHDAVVELANNSTVPVINALSNLAHPCQALADVMTIWEIKGNLKGLKVAFLGDGNNNVTHSLLLISAMLGMDFVCATPARYQMKEEVVQLAKEISKKTGTKISQTANPRTAVEGADVVVTDTWVSMGNEKEKAKRLKTFRKYQVNTKVMKKAKSGAIFMHCLPAYRGNEVAGEVIDGVQSVVFQGAENRLHVQKALILFLLGCSQ